MVTALLYPYILLRFWYKEATVGFLQFYKDLNSYVANLLSLPLFVKTFFKPLKNEYRKGLVGFSIGMGIVLKSVLITVDVVVIVALIAAEVLFFSAFVAFPFMLIYFGFLL